MTSTIEYLALGAVAIVLVVVLVQAVQLSGLNEKAAEQNTALASLVSGGNTSAPAQSKAPTQAAPAPSQQMVGGC